MNNTPRQDYCSLTPPRNNAIMVRLRTENVMNLDCILQRNSISTILEYVHQKKRMFF